MIDREKVLKGLKCCSMNGNGCRQCPYNKDCDEMPDYGNAYLCSDAMELLKEQQETIVSLQSTINKLTKALAEQPEQKFFVDSDGKITPLPIQPQWISVKDRMPDAAGYECLVCAVNENYNQTHVFTAHTGYGEPGWWTGNVHYMSRVTSPSDNRLHPALNVTHWMPLPEPPKEVKKDAID